MNPKLLESLRRSDQHLSNSSATNHRLLLDKLCRTHSRVFPQSLDLLHFISRGLWGEAYSLVDSWSRQKYLDPTQHFVANQFAALLKKYPFESSRAERLGFNPLDTAMKNFWRSEHKCKRVNQRFRAYGRRSPYESALTRARAWIRYVIGDSPNLEAIFRNCKWGPGANIGVHGNATNVARKLLAKRWSVTPGAWQYGRYSFINHAQIFELLCPKKGTVIEWDADRARDSYDQRVTILHHNKIAFVPKTAKVHRTIAVEPLVNSYLQSGVDTILKQRLLRVGIDLRDQTRNQRLAYIGSINDSGDSYCTIDLSNASDSLAIEVVRNLLPPEWFEFLNSIRSPNGLLNGELFRYQKFCSMGNGFCFPLETLIFAAICIAAGAAPGDFSVYGDDIIVRRSVVLNLIHLLGVCGFSVNEEKSFLEGPFRESCGEDYFAGEAVRPTTLDYPLDSTQSVFIFHNMTLRSERTKLFFDCIRPLLRDLVPPELRFCRPYPGNADSAFEVDHDMFLASPFSNWNRMIQTWSWKELRTTPVRDHRPAAWAGFEVALVVAALTGGSSYAPFTLRRKSRTKVVVCGSSATSTAVFT